MSEYASPDGLEVVSWYLNWATGNQFFYGVGPCGQWVPVGGFYWGA